MKTRILLAAAFAAIAHGAIAGSPGTAREWRFTPHGELEVHEILADAATARGEAEGWRAWAEDFRNSMHAMYAPRFGGKVVKGAPYGAEVVTENTRTLADGNVIASRTTGRVYRDGEGRTRQETIAGGETRSLTIVDPAAGEAWVQPPGMRRSLRAPRVAIAKDGKEMQVIRLGDTEIRIEDGKVSVDGREAGPGRVELKAGGKAVVIDGGKVTIDGKELAPGGERRVVIKRLGGSETGDGTEREEIRIQVLRPEGGAKDIVVPVPPLPPMPPITGLPLAPGHTWRFEGSSKLGKGVTTRLGVKEFDGVKAEGSSTVWTIPAGEIGNRNPIQVTSESWYAPELQVTVYSRRNDPRTGESVYRLANIRRGEPAPELFRLPEEAEAGARAKRHS